MNTQQTQIKINLPSTMKDFLESKARKFGMPVSGYLKHLILKDIEDLEYPTFQASKRTEEAYLKAKEDQKQGKTITITNIENFFEEL